MKKAEFTLAVLAVATLICRVSSMPGSEWLCTAAFGLLILFYLLIFPRYYYRLSLASLTDAPQASLQREQSFRLFMAVAAGIVFALALTGILFVLNYWKLASFFWCLGLFFTVPVGALSLGKHMMQPEAFYKGLAIRAGVLLIVGIALVAAQM